MIVVSGLDGSQIPTVNLAPTAAFVLFWVGMPVLSALLGDVFRPINPWRAAARGVGAIVKRTRLAGDPLPYPGWLGRWPAVAGIIGFAWLQLVLFVNRQHPATLAVLAVAYALIQLVGMAFYGIERWSTRGDAFAVVLNLFSRLAPIELRDGCRLAPAAPVRSHGDHARAWNGGADVRDDRHDHVRRVRGMSYVSARHPARELAGAFAHSLAPIAFGYLLAHYFSLLVTQGQATAFLISIRWEPVPTSLEQPEPRSTTASCRRR